MKKKILIIQGSSLKKINIKTDTSFFLGLEAQRRSYQIYYYEPKDLSFINGKVTALCSKVKFVDNPKQPIKVINKTVLNLLQAKLILIRSEPPFNQQYINTTFILEYISKKVRIINHPKALREVPEKLFSLRLTKYMPQTLISENLNEIKSFGITSEQRINAVKYAEENNIDINALNIPGVTDDSINTQRLAVEFANEKNILINKI